MTLDTAVLADLAARATPGPWGHGFWSGACQKHEVGQHPGEPKCVYDWTLVHDADGETIFDNPHRIVSLQEPIDIAGNYDYEEGGIVKEADAAYIAAFSPDVAAALLAEVESLRKVGRKVIDVEEAYRAALNGGGHPGEPHDRALHFGPVLPGGIEVFDEVGDCSNCGGQQYGTEDDQQQAIAELRIALGIPLRPFEDFRAALVSEEGSR